MASKYPVLKPREIIKILAEFGFIFISQKGSHAKYSNGIKTTIVPMHSEVEKGTLKSILKLADISLEDFMDKL